MKWVLLFLSFCSALSSYEYRLSACAIFQNEAPYLKEWIDFHRTVGVEHFWLYNHLSDDNYKEVLSPYLEEGIVELTEWKRPFNNLEEWNLIQCGAYNDGISRSIYKSQWLVVLDTDEFIYPMDKNNLIAFLQDYDRYSSIGVNWQMFGTSHVDSIASDESVLKKLVWKAHWDYIHNKHVKCIVKPKHVLFYENPHYPILKKNSIQVNADQVEFNGPFSPYVSLDKIRINHYWTRDEYYLLRCKIPRRSSWSNNIEWVLQMAGDMNEVYDTAIHRFLD